MRSTLHRFGLRAFLGVVTLMACSDAAPPPASPSAKPAGIRFPDPPASVRGTAAPGDLFQLTIAQGHFTLTGDSGTPGSPADDFKAEGQVTVQGGSFPVLLVVSSSTHPALAAVGKTYQALELPGLGWAVALERVAVSAYEIGPCSLAALPELSTFGASSPTRLDGVRSPLFSTLTATGADLALVSYGASDAAGSPDPATKEEWSLKGATCASDGSVHFATITTPGQRAHDGDPVKYPYAFKAPDPNATVGFFSKAGALLVDFGKGFGGVIAVPTKDVLDRQSDGAKLLGKRVAGRRLSGFLTEVSVFQPVGADRNDPSVARTSTSRVLRVEVVMGNGQNGVMHVETLDGTLVKDGLDTLVALSRGSLALTLGSTLSLTGITVDTARGTSFVASSPAVNEQQTVAELATPAPTGTELVFHEYVAQLRLSAPRDCFAPNFALPSAYTANLASNVASVRGLDVSRISVQFQGNGPVAKASPRSGSASIDFSAAPPFMLMKSGTPVQLSAVAPNPIRLYCGPEYPWAPGADLYGAVDGVDTGAGGNVGFVVPGTYIVESSPPGAPGGAGSQWYVFEVQ